MNELQEAIELLKKNPNKSNYTEEALKLLRIMNTKDNALPDKVEPVLAEITRIGDLNRHSWYEIVYYDSKGKWKTYQFNSSTFDTENDKVLRWKYCSEVFSTCTHSAFLNGYSEEDEGLYE